MIRWRGFVIVSVFICYAATAWSVEVTRTEERTIDFSYEGLVSLHADEGDITVRGWDKEVVQLKMTLRSYGRDEREAEQLLDQIEVRIQESRDRLFIREEPYDNRQRFNFFDVFERDFWRENRWRSPRVDYDLTVPMRIALKLENDEGDVDVSGVVGPVSIDVDEGDVMLESVISDDVEIRADEGYVDLNDVEGTDRSTWKIETDEGTIRVGRGAVEEMDLGTDEGRIEVGDLKVRQFWMSADEGDIEVDFLPLQNGDYRIEADEGDVEIVIPREANLGVRLRTEDGRIDSDFDLPVRMRDDSEMMEGLIGKDEGMLRVTTDDGDILLRRSR